MPGRGRGQGHAVLSVGHQGPWRLLHLRWTNRLVLHAPLTVRRPLPSRPITPMPRLLPSICLPLLRICLFSPSGCISVFLFLSDFAGHGCLPPPLCLLSSLLPAVISPGGGGTCLRITLQIRPSPPPPRFSLVSLLSSVPGSHVLSDPPAPLPLPHVCVPPSLGISGSW